MPFIENVAFAAKHFRVWLLFGREIAFETCLVQSKPHLRASLSPTAGRKVHLAKQEPACGDPWARAVPDTGALLTACGKATGCIPKHKGTDSLEGRQREGTPGQKPGRTVTFSSSLLSIPISTLIVSWLLPDYDLCLLGKFEGQAHFSFLVHQNT